MGLRLEERVGPRWVDVATPPGRARAITIDEIWPIPNTNDAVCFIRGVPRTLDMMLRRRDG